MGGQQNTPPPFCGPHPGLPIELSWLRPLFRRLRKLLAGLIQLLVTLLSLLRGLLSLLVGLRKKAGALCQEGAGGLYEEVAMVASPRLGTPSL